MAQSRAQSSTAATLNAETEQAHSGVGEHIPTGYRGLQAALDAVALRCGEGVSD